MIEGRESGEAFLDRDLAHDRGDGFQVDPVRDIEAGRADGQAAEQTRRIRKRRGRKQTPTRIGQSVFAISSLPEKRQADEISPDDELGVVPAPGRGLDEKREEKNRRGREDEGEGAEKRSGVRRERGSAAFHVGSASSAGGLLRAAIFPRLPTDHADERDHRAGSMRPKFISQKLTDGGGKAGIALQPAGRPGEDRLRLEMIGDHPDDARSRAEKPRRAGGRLVCASPTCRRAASSRARSRARERCGRERAASSRRATTPPTRAGSRARPRRRCR